MKINKITNDVYEIQPEIFKDARGYFYESFNLNRYEKIGINGPWLQDNNSKSSKGDIRGLHFQYPKSQGKLITVLYGCIFDVIIDVIIDAVDPDLCVDDDDCSSDQFCAIIKCADPCNPCVKIGCPNVFNLACFAPACLPHVECGTNAVCDVENHEDEAAETIENIVHTAENTDAFLREYTADIGKELRAYDDMDAHIGAILRGDTEKQRKQRAKRQEQRKKLEEERAEKRALVHAKMLENRRQRALERNAALVKRAEERSHRKLVDSLVKGSEVEDENGR